MILRDLLADPTQRTTFGKVTATSPLTVQFNGTAAADAVAGMKRLSSYTPTNGDLVQLDLVGSIWIVQGKIT